MTSTPTHTLNDGGTIPAIGLGTYGLHGDSGADSIAAGIDGGYRLLDTALNYGNEQTVTEGIRRSGIAREEIFVTTKLPGRFHGYENTLKGFEESRENLGLDDVDLYLIHWPLPRVNQYVESWKAMIELRERGLVRSIGVSNFTVEHLTRVIDETGVTPAVNQVELHPYFPQSQLREFHERNGIITESWSPLGKGSGLLEDPVVVDIAGGYEVSPAQVVLRWHTQLPSVPIPKSGDSVRQRENLDIFSFTLDDSEMEAMSALERGRLWGGDPETNEEF
ncbi:aldo/keto reductase [Rathayibacter sp. YIM 133350]|uniref:aldo/keto reductase n=1 Tax=Rathayibacter sp. YIM 133350 TaxID=3131992 RepID=UPI00307F5BAE